MDSTLKVSPTNLNKTTKSKWEVFCSNLQRDKYLYLLLLPFIAYYIVFCYIPMYGLQIAFKDYNPFVGITKSEWVGWTHFINFFSNPFAERVIRNTILLNVYNLIFGFPIPIILALLFNEVRNQKFKTVIQTVSYLPHFISVVIVAGLVTNFLAPSNGLINILIEKFGGEKVYFLTKPEYFRFIYNFITIWHGAGYASIVYLAALCGINHELYEAAKIDGAGKFRQLINITIPGILPTIAIMFILRVGNLLNVGFETIILLYQPSTYETADVISTYVYREGLLNSSYSSATAIGLFNGVVAVILVSIANAISKKISDIGI